MAPRPYNRLGAYSSGSLFQNDYVNRDVEYLSYFYKDNGFANVTKTNTLRMQFAFVF